MSACAAGIRLLHYANTWCYRHRRVYSKAGWPRDGSRLLACPMHRNTLQCCMPDPTSITLPYTSELCLHVLLPERLPESGASDRRKQYRGNVLFGSLRSAS